jgi:hydroxyacylglutathione hydrolase
MVHVVTKSPLPFLSRTGAIRVHQIPAWQDNFIWLIECTRTGTTAIVDGPEATPLLDYLSKNKLSLNTIFNTHTHGDHIGVNRDLAKKGLLESLDVVGSATAPTAIPGLTQTVSDGDEVAVGHCAGTVMLTEGHINGHVSYLFDGVLFCGDTLFSGGCGYLFDGPPAKMHASLVRLAALPSDTKVCCAHEYTQDNLRFAYSVEPGNTLLQERIRDVWRRRSDGESVVPSTIGVERETNPFIRTHSSEIMANVHRALPDLPMVTSLQVFAATRKLKDRKDYREMSNVGFPS